MSTANVTIKLPNQKTNIEWTSYLATAYTEGFCEGENSTLEEQMEGWACLIKTGVCWSLQGFFGRTASQLLDSGFIEKDGTINWDVVEEKSM
jgi:hypothetical protein